MNEYSIITTYFDIALVSALFGILVGFLLRIISRKV
jgi:hypothetical protein